MVYKRRHQLTLATFFMSWVKTVKKVYWNLYMNVYKIKNTNLQMRIDLRVSVRVC